MQTLVNIWHRMVGGKSLLLLAALFAAFGLWFFYDSAGPVADYSVARKQLWISPERLAYITKMEAEVAKAERDSLPVIEELGQGSELKAEREARAAEVRRKLNELRERFTQVKQVHNDAFVQAQAELDKALAAAKAALEAARQGAP